LWCKSTDTGCWEDAGAAGGTVLLVGQQLEAATGGVFRACSHACRVDPTGERLDTTLPSHPGAPRRGNRQSMALVICQ